MDYFSLLIISFNEIIKSIIIKNNLGFSIENKLNKTSYT